MLPSEIINTTSPLRSQDFTNLLQLYEDDLPFIKSFDVELDLWQNKWTSEPQLALTLNTPAKIVAHTDYDYFPNIHTLVFIVATLPVTSCECERSISMLKLVKTSLQSTMSQDHLNGLAIFSITEVRVSKQMRW